MQKISVATKQDIVVLEERAKAVSTKANFKITSQETLKKANEIMATLKVAKKFVSEKKASIIQPLLLATKNTRELFKPIESIIFDAELRLKEGVLAYKKQVDEAIAKQKEKIEKEVESGEKTFDQASEKIEKVEAKTGEFKTRKIQKLVITDEKKIPREYLTINEVLLRRDLISGKSIPGAELKIEEIAL